MSTLAEIEKAIETLPPEQWLEIRRWIDHRLPEIQGTSQRRTLPRVARTGQAITQQEIDDALDAE